LALHFLSRANQDNQRNVSLAPDALTELEQHPWPGNIRELGNVIERLVLLTDSAMVHAKELRRFLPADNGDAPLLKPVAASVHAPLPLLVRDYQAVQSHSAVQLQQALQAHGGNQSRAAQALGLTARQFGYRLRKLGLPDAR
jgi:Nif-specific regulatory protein